MKDMMCPDCVEYMKRVKGWMKCPKCGLKERESAAEISEAKKNRNLTDRRERANKVGGRKFNLEQDHKEDEI